MKAKERITRDNQIFAGIAAGKTAASLAKKHHLTSDYVRRLVQEKDRDWSAKRVQPNEPVKPVKSMKAKAKPNGAVKADAAVAAAAVVAEKKAREAELTRYEIEIDTLKKELSKTRNERTDAYRTAEKLQSRIEHLHQEPTRLMKELAEVHTTLANTKADMAAKLRNAELKRSEEGLTDLNLFAGTLIAALTRWMQKP